jgi:cysteine synthase
VRALDSGGGIGHWPPILRPEDFDEVIAVPQAEAFAMARRAAGAEGLLAGPSTGANLTAALQPARRLGSGRRVVTVQVDSGLKYLAGDLFQ